MLDHTLPENQPVRLATHDALRFKVLFESMSQGVVYQDNTGAITMANPAAEQILGLTRDQMMGVTSIDPRWKAIRADGSDFPGSEHPSMESLRAGKPFLNVVMGIFNPEKNAHRWLLVSAIPEFLLGESRPYQVYTTFTDFTDRKLSEDHARYQTRLQELLMETARMYINLNLDGLDQAIEHSLKTLGEFVCADRFYIFEHDTVHGVFNNTHEWCADGISPQIDLLQNFPVSDFPDWTELHYVGKPMIIPDIHALDPESTLWKTLEPQGIQSMVAVPMMNGSKYDGFIGIDAVRQKRDFSENEVKLLTVLSDMIVLSRNRIADIQRILASETQYRQITENMTDVIWTADLHFELTYCSPSSERLFGEPNEAYFTHPTATQYTPESLARFVKFIDRIRRDKGVPFSKKNLTEIIELETVRPDGSWIWISYSIMPNIDKEGSLTGYLGVIREITDQKTAEYELRKSRYEINERLKELRCMYEIARLSKDYTLTETEFLQRTVDMIPSGFQFAEVTSAAIQLEGKDYRSAQCTPSRNYIQVDIETSFGRSGEIKVYLSEAYEFLPEEHHLIRAIKDAVEQHLENHHATVTLRNSEERLTNLVNSQTNYVLRTNLEGYHTYWNPKFAEDFGWIYGQDSINNGNSLSSIIDYHHGRTKSTVNKCIENPGRIFNVELDKPTREGGVRSTLWEFVCLTDPQGNPAEIQCMGIDITAKVVAERELHKLTIAIEQSPVALVVTDSQAMVLYTSPAFTTITGYESDEVRGRGIKILKSGLTSPEVYKDLWSTIRSGKLWQWEWVNRKKNGELYWENISITPMLADNGEITGYLSIKQDISQRKKAEQEILDLNQNLERRITERTRDLEQTNLQLEQARNEAEQANHAKSEFLSRMSHELRTPMNAILGFAQLLEMGDLSGSQRKGVAHILRAGKHLLELINEVLDISRIEAGRISMSMESVNLHNVVQEMLETVAPLAQQQRIRLISELPADDKIHVNADKQRLKQILLNIINNSIKYNADDGAVWIRAHRLPAAQGEQEKVRISVTDSGLGIAATDFNRIFIPFERLNANRTAVEGTGLGLAVVKKLVDIMGGSIGVDSVVGEGSTFWLEFPSAPDQPYSLLPHGRETAGTSDIQRAGTVLYIEDNISNIELVEQILETSRPGIHLITTMYGLQTVQLAKEYHPDLILLDLNLPDAHGSDVLVSLKLNPATSQIPVVIISADAMPNQMETLKAIGAQHYLTKPIKVQALLNVVDEFITKTSE